MIDAAFRIDAQNVVGPLNITLEAGEAASLCLENPRAASIAARLAAALIKTTTGTVLVGNFDAKVQPVQVKRLVGFVPVNPTTPPFKNIDAYFRFRADLWEVERSLALQRGRTFLEQCERPSDPYAIALAGALISPCALIVWDQPRAEYIYLAKNERSAGAAILTTHAMPSQREAIAAALASYEVMTP